jgi:hypothetical protein
LVHVVTTTVDLYIIIYFLMRVPVAWLSLGHLVGAAILLYYLRCFPLGGVCCTPPRCYEYTDSLTDIDLHHAQALMFVQFLVFVTIVHLANVSAMLLGVVLVVFFACELMCHSWFDGTSRSARSSAPSLSDAPLCVCVCVRRSSEKARVWQSGNVDSHWIRVDVLGAVLPSSGGT